MPTLSWIARRAASEIEHAEIRGVALAGGRSLLAFSALATILFSTNSALFPQTSEHPLGIHCAGLRAVSLWCATGSTDTGMTVSRVISAIVLVVSMTGFRPAWTCVPHWYVTFSLAAAMPESNGGDKIAQIATLLLIPMCLGDDRTWHWEAIARPLPASWRGGALAAHVMLRAQLLAVYVGAALSKLTDPLWRQGSAMYVISRMPQFGFSSSLGGLVKTVLSSYWSVAILSWSIIAVQIVIAALILAPRRFRFIALVLATVLHLGILVLMDLVSFGLIMIAVLLMACARTSRTVHASIALNERMAS
ncbi:hypothetical protein F0L68_33665 [Solihabitans fulvus]|uniref:HTTM-like domain-containing protein n=1 Tax=Solihabitans fulvus TaxID=1892852 RepID=A0A5B2WRS0_9PSEU|nr:sporulation-delaying protein SdpB family protein [Solihabitans fulvus]KAA2253099.1 hypothetical protein F0L68_33665 [Solihabitans fulvus]